MISFFTDPYKDELIYSAIARYHYYIGNIDFRDTLEELLGSRNAIPSLEIGASMDKLYQNIGGKYTADYIIKNHTIFPYYKPFLAQDRQAELISDIKSSDGRGIYARLGYLAGSVCKKQGVFYCPICAGNEIEQFGETFIHREHQLQGVLVCPHHGAKLRKYAISKNMSSRIEFIRFDESLLDLNEDNPYENNHKDKLCKLSKDAYYILNLDFEDISKDVILQRYKNILYEKGLTTSNERVKQQELYQEFTNFYGKEFLNFMDSEVDNDDEYNWLRVATRDLKRAVHPIRHILLINFLEGDIEKFFTNIKKQFYPFGKGPWPCLNKASEHYKQHVVKKLTITNDYATRQPVGTFRCDCGFVYSRKGPDKTKEDKYRIGRIKNFGRVWEAKLTEYLMEQKYGLREIARLMKCDPKTVLKFDKQIGINYFKASKCNTVASAKEGKVSFIKEYRKTILESIRNNPKANRTFIRNICKKEYTYLYRRDKVWLLSNLPKQPPHQQYNIKHKKVDWIQRDIKITKLMKNKYEELFKSKIPIRITKTVIGKSLGILATLEKNIDKLPKTKKYLDEITETLDAFRIRRCKKIIEEHLKNKEQIKLWQLKKIAGIRSEDFKKIEKEILSYIEERQLVYL